MALKRQKLVIVITHPIQYHAPLYRRIAEADLFDLHVIFHNDRGARAYYDQSARATVSYDNGILEGYHYQFLTRGDPVGLGQKLQQRFLPSLIREIIRHQPTAVYFHGYNHPAHIQAMLRLGKHGIKVLLRGENEDVLPRSWWRNWSRETLLHQLLPKLSGILYIGEKNREFFSRRGFSKDKMFFVPYSADNEYFGINLMDTERLAIRRQIAADYSFDPNQVIFVHTCKHRAEKQPLDVVDGFIKANQHRTTPLPATLLLVGDGPLRSEMEARIVKAELRNAVFTGYVNQSKLKQCLLAADYCINAAPEPWGCVFNEALPAGLGIISSDRVVGWHDMVKIGGNGFIYRFGCTDSLAHILRQCAEHPEWIPGFREESKKLARIYSYDTCVSGLKQALDACSA